MSFSNCLTHRGESCLHRLKKKSPLHVLYSRPDERPSPWHQERLPVTAACKKQDVLDSYGQTIAIFGSGRKERRRRGVKKTVKLILHPHPLTKKSLLSLCVGLTRDDQGLVGAANHKSPGHGCFSLS